MHGGRKHILRLLALLGVGLALSACGGGGTVTGTAFYRERIALPPNAVFEATLEDVSRADAPADVINSVTIPNPGNPPFSFSIPYTGQQIDKRHRYSVRGTIRVDDRLLMTTTRAYPVITQGMPEAATILLTSVPQSRGTGNESGDIEGPPLPESFIGAHGLRLPATYEGVLPCADCPGIRWRLNLMPDQTFYVRLDYLERGGFFEDSGRWSLQDGNRILALSGRGGTSDRFTIEDGSLTKLDTEGRPIPSGINTLKRAREFAWVDVTHPMRGHYEPGAGGGQLTDCVSGHTYPLAGDSRMLIEAGNGGPVTLDLRAQITRPDDSDEAMLRPLDVGRIYPGEGCDRHRAAAPLINTYWRLVELEGEEVRVIEGAREPHIILRREDNRFAATAGCNQIGGTYRLTGDRISFSETRSTLMACRPSLNELERRFNSFLLRAATWRLNGQSLEVTTTDGATALFEAVYFH